MAPLFDHDAARRLAWRAVFFVAGLCALVAGGAFALAALYMFLAGIVQPPAAAALVALTALVAALLLTAIGLRLPGARTRHQPASEGLDEERAEQILESFLAGKALGATVGRRAGPRQRM